jgi:hypothetical protein
VAQAAQDVLPILNATRRKQPVDADLHVIERF